MPDHCHLLVRRNKDGQMGRLFRWVTGTHPLRHHGHCNTRGYGHLYQARFKSFRVQADSHFYTVFRYVERNSVRVKLVSSAKPWKHGSLLRWNPSSEPNPRILTPWPIRRLPNWNHRVDAALSKPAFDALRPSVERGQPYGSPEWVEEVAEQHGLWSTIRLAGLPRKRKPAT